jgi:curved DNA-binding protein
MPNPRGPAGDLYAELVLQVPARVTGRERDLYEELGKVSTFDPREGR